LDDLASLWNSSDSWLFGFVEVVSVGTPVSQQASIFIICTLPELPLEFTLRQYGCFVAFDHLHSVTNLQNKLIGMASLWNRSDSWLFGFVEVVSVGTVVVHRRKSVFLVG
jgi:hypothetical protein